MTSDRNESFEIQRVRPGVDPDGEHGFPTLSSAYVNRIRTSLLLTADADIRSSKLLPGRMKHNLPVVEVQLEPEVQKNTSRNVGGQQVMVMKNEARYFGTSSSHRGPPSPFSTSHSFSRVTPSPPPVIRPQSRTSPRSVFRPSPGSPLRVSPRFSPHSTGRGVSPRSAGRGGSPISLGRRGASPHSIKRGSSSSNSRRASNPLKHTSPFKFYKQDESADNDFEEDYDLADLYAGYMEFNPESKYGLADRKKSVRQPNKQRQADPMRRRHTAFSFNVDIIQLSRMSSQQPKERSHFARMKSAQKELFPLPPVSLETRRSAPDQTTPMHGGPSPPMVFIQPPEQPDKAPAYEPLPFSFEQAAEVSAIEERSEWNSEREEEEERLAKQRQEMEERAQKKQKSRQAFKFLNEYVGKLKKVPREQKLSSLHKGLTTMMATQETQITPPEQRVRLLSHIRENTEISESEGDDSNQERKGSSQPRGSLSSVGGDFYSRMANVLADVLRGSSGGKDDEKYRKYSAKLVDQMEQQHLRQSVLESSDWSSSVDKSLEEQDEIRSQEEGGGSVSGGAFLTIPSEKSASSGSLRQQESGGGTSGQFSFKLELKKVASPQIHEFRRIASPPQRMPNYSYSSRDMKGQQAQQLEDGPRGANTARAALRLRQSQEAFFYGPDFMDWISQEAAKPSRMTLREEKQKRGSEKKLDKMRSFSPLQPAEPPPVYANTPPVKSESTKLVSVKILDTEKDFKLKVVQTEHKDSDSDDPPLHEEVWKKRYTTVQMTGVDRRTTSDWRKWYKYA